MTDQPKLTRTQRGQVRRATNRLLCRERREFPSSSDPNKMYVAMVMADGMVTCNCRGWTFKKGSTARRCKHTDELIGERSARSDGEHFFLEGV